MADEDTRNWAERRIDARREASGLDDRASHVAPARKARRDRPMNALLLLLGGILFLVFGQGLGIVVAVVFFGAAVYQLVVMAVATGVRESRE